MENIILLFGAVAKIFIRVWSKKQNANEDVFVDMVEFAQALGLNAFEARKFGRTIDTLVDEMAEDFFYEIANKADDKERMEEILRQVLDDVHAIGLEEERIFELYLAASELQKEISSRSEVLRKDWGDKDNGIYLNCVKYVTKVICDYVQTLPSYNSYALKTIIEREEICLENLHRILKEMKSIRDAVRSVDAVNREFEEIYRNWIIVQYSKIELIGASNLRRELKKYDISLAYVSLCCSQDGEGDEIELSDVFCQNRVVWIKGDAGSGKTTFLQWVAICAAKNDYTKIQGINGRIPIVVKLRNTEWPLNLNVIMNKISEQIGYSCPDGWLKSKIEDGRILVLLDGVDEVEASKREEVHEFIEDLCINYPNIQILTTARKSVDIDLRCNYTSYEIRPMRISQVNMFVNYWHGAVLKQDAIEVNEKIEQLKATLKARISNSTSLRSLARNPLLCAMICALNYTNDELLPEGKMELYEKCCEMLIDARDLQRRIIWEPCEILDMDYSKKRRLLEEIAYWMLKTGVTSVEKDLLIEFIGNLSENMNFMREISVTVDANAILKYLIERSGIIREPEEGIIDFVHKSFMEFLAVKPISRSCEWSLLVKEACNPLWKETIIMCFADMSIKHIGDIIEELIQKGEEQNDKRYILLAAIGVSNAFILEGKVKERIFEYIDHLIPPKTYSDVSNLSKAGTYLLPFLFNKDSYTDSERELCLLLLDYIESAETIPHILSFLTGRSGNSVKLYALDTLCKFTEDDIEEYMLKEQLVSYMIKSIDNNKLITFERLLYLLQGYDYDRKKLLKLRKIKKIMILGGNIEQKYASGELSIMPPFSSIEELIVDESILSKNILRAFDALKTLKLKTYDLSEIVCSISEIKELHKVKKLVFMGTRLSYFCERDLTNFNELEWLELHCDDYRTEFDFYSFSSLPKLKKFVIGVDRDIAMEVGDMLQNYCIVNDEFSLMSIESLHKLDFDY